MNKEENTPLPEDPPVTVGEDEIDRLLSQAEEMAEEIASDTGVESGVEDLDAAPETASADPADPLAEVENIDRKLAELGNLVEVAESEGTSEQKEGPSDTHDVAAGGAEPQEAGEAEATSQPEEAPVKRSARVLLRKWQEVAQRTGRVVATAISAGITRMLLTLDRPFANLSPLAKQRIGIVALVTVLMGLASLLLPGMFEHNPYEAMEP